MKIKCPLYFMMLLGFITLNYNTVKAQKNKKEAIVNIAASSAASINGNLEEWPEQKLQDHKTSGLSYLIANNDSTLFVVIKSQNTADMQRFLIGGLSISFNANGQKKAIQTINFPLLPRKRPQANTPQRTAKLDPKLKLKEELEDIKEIGISGFNQLLDGKIAVENEYGIKAAASLNPDGLLVCEYALPIKLLQIDAFKSDIFACQIKVNGLNNEFRNSNFGGGMIAGRGGLMQRNMPSSDLLQGSDFWVLCRLLTETK